MSVCERDQATVQGAGLSVVFYVCERGSSWFVLVGRGSIVIAALAVSRQ